PVVTGEQKAKAYALLEQEALAKHAAIHRLGDAFTLTPLQQLPLNQVYTWRSGSKKRNVSLRAMGVHQMVNSALAIKALDVLKESGCALNDALTQDGISRTTIPGPFELIFDHPVILLDGAHNPAGIRSFLQAAETHYGNKEKHLLFAGFKDKDLETMLDMLSPH